MKRLSSVLQGPKMSTELYGHILLIKKIVYEIGLSEVDAVKLSDSDMLKMAGGSDLCSCELACLKRHCVKAARRHKRSLPMRGISSQLEGGYRKWFREKFPDANVTQSGRTVVIQLDGLEKEVDD